jgi:hypothetical protein
VLEAGWGSLLPCPASFTLRKENSNMCSSIKSVSGKKGEYLDWIRWFSQVLLIPMLGLTLWAFWNHEERLDLLQLGQQNRFIASDGLKVWQQISEIQKNVLVTQERLSNHIQNTVPASELVRSEEFMNHERRIAKLEGGK